MRVHIRGNFGTQILQAATALAPLPEASEPILCINHGNLPYDGTNKLRLVFTPKIRCIDVDMTNKTPYWKAGVASQIFNNREKIFNWLVPKDLPFELGCNAVHIRGRDKKVYSDASNKKLLQLANDPFIIFTDDEKYVETLTDRPDKIYSQDMETDWLSLYNANHVWAAPSAFILCMLLFNPNKKITILGDKYCDGGYDFSQDMIFVRECQQYCPNLEIIDD